MKFTSQNAATPILLVDDRPENLLSLEELLSNQGYELVRASSGNEALRLTLKQDFALLLLDVQMPDMDGFETAELMRANSKTRHVPIIFVTAGMKELQFQFKGYDAGAVDYLAKPIEPLFLQSKVRIFAEMYRQRREIELHKNNMNDLVELKTTELRLTAAELKASNEKLEQRVLELAQMSRDLTESYDALHDQTVQLEDEMAKRQKSHEALHKKTVELEEEIAERIRIQQEHRRLEEQLQQSLKMEAIGLLAGGVAHDFNNILSVIMGYGSLLMLDLPEGRTHDNVIQILNASERAAELTKALLAFSRKQTFNLERSDINQLTADNSKFLKRVIGEDIEFIAAYHHAPLYVLVDRPQIQQILMNLATNARDAMPSGGKLKISITSEILNDDTASVKGCGSTEDYAVIRVCDTGTGMDKGTVGRIFEPFFTTKEQGKGTGLGLSMIHGIVAQHNGFVRCSSEPGQGTTFSIYLPLCEKCAQATAPATEMSRNSLRGAETILLAEDDQMLMEINTRYLEFSGYKVLQAFDGAEAVSIFTKHPDEIDLVLLDAIMPKMTGKQVWKAISSLRPNVKACFVSGYTNEIISGKLAVDFSIPFISKPVMPGVLLQKVREILDVSNAES